MRRTKTQQNFHDEMSAINKNRPVKTYRKYNRIPGSLIFFILLFIVILYVFYRTEQPNNTDTIANASSHLKTIHNPFIKNEERIEYSDEEGDFKTNAIDDARNPIVKDIGSMLNYTSAINNTTDLEIINENIDLLLNYKQHEDLELYKILLLKEASFRQQLIELNTDPNRTEEQYNNLTDMFNKSRNDAEIEMLDVCDKHLITVETTKYKNGNEYYFTYQ